MFTVVEVQVEFNRVVFCRSLPLHFIGDLLFVGFTHVLLRVLLERQVTVVQVIVVGQWPFLSLISLLLYKLLAGQQGTTPSSLPLQINLLAETVHLLLCFKRLDVIEVFIDSIANNELSLHIFVIVYQLILFCVMRQFTFVRILFELQKWHLQVLHHPLAEVFSISELHHS